MQVMAKLEPYAEIVVGKHCVYISQQDARAAQRAFNHNELTDEHRELIDAILTCFASP